MSRWFSGGFLIDWSFVLEDGSSLCETISKQVTCLMSADQLEMFGRFCSAGCLVLGHREVADGPGWHALGQILSRAYMSVSGLQGYIRVCIRGLGVSDCGLAARVSKL